MCFSSYGWTDGAAQRRRRCEEVCRPAIGSHHIPLRDSYDSGGTPCRSLHRRPVPRPYEAPPPSSRVNPEVEANKPEDYFTTVSSQVPAGTWRVVFFWPAGLHLAVYFTETGIGALAILTGFRDCGLRWCAWWQVLAAQHA